MKNPVYIFFFILSLIAGLCNCSDPPQKVEAPTEIKLPPQKDTLDQLAENFIQNADTDSVNLEETLPIEELPEKKIEKAEKSSKKEKKKRPRKKPKIVFENESFSFGRIMQGEEKEFKFKGEMKYISKVWYFKTNQIMKFLFLLKIKIILCLKV